MDRKEFDAVVSFHGCYCLDIAMGYRVAKALIREMGDELSNMKQVAAYVGTSTCAVDAIQQLAGCTLGKRNLIMTQHDKPTYILHNTKSGNARRAYVHYWDNFDHSELRRLKSETKKAGASDKEKGALKTYLDESIERILDLPEQELFSLTSVTMSAPAMSGKFKSTPCACCGEYTKDESLEQRGDEKVCRECLTTTTKNY